METCTHHPLPVVHYVPHASRLGARTDISPISFTWLCGLETSIGCMVGQGLLIFRKHYGWRECTIQYYTCMTVILVCKQRVIDHLYLTLIAQTGLL